MVKVVNGGVNRRMKMGFERFKENLAEKRFKDQVVPKLVMAIARFG